jgi:hypothetical protein
LGLEENHFKWSFEDEEKDEIPAIFKILSGPKDPEKIKLANTVLVDWQVNLKKKVKKSKKRKSEEEEEEKEEKNCPYYAPSSQSKDLRIFFPYMSRHYQWEFSEKDFHGFRGCLDGVMKSLFLSRFEVWVSFSDFSKKRTVEVEVILTFFICSYREKRAMVNSVKT